MCIRNRAAREFADITRSPTNTSQPVETVLVSVPEEVTEHHLQFTPAATLQSDDRPRQVAIYRMKQPLPAGATGSLDFRVGIHAARFSE